MRTLSTLLFVAVPLVLSVAVPARAQAPRVNEDHWKTEGEVGGSVFFGNKDQTAFLARASTATRGLAREFSVNGAFNYGEASTDDGGSAVNRRSWKLGVDLDPVPNARLSPFLSAKAEGSYEKRIDLRYNVGAGGKLTVAGDDSDGRLDLSVAVLAERTLPSEDASATADDRLDARWSTRLRARHDLSEGRVTLQTETHYQPRFDRIDDFTMSSTSSVAFRVTEVLSLKLTFVDNYDSEALDRGASTNNDGQVFFSVLSAF